MPKRKRVYNFERDEVFDVICFYMGQGDCSLIHCPDDKIVMIDCGGLYDFNAQYQKIVVDQVRDPDWAGHKMLIDALILTHSDTDHHNQVVSVLGAPNLTGTKEKKLAIDKIYLSRAKDDTSPLAYYQGGQLAYQVINKFFMTSELYEVTICSEDDNKNFYKKWTEKDNFKNVVINQATKKAEWPIIGKKWLLFGGVTPTNGISWSVSLIAGNVRRETSPIDDLGKDEKGWPFVDGSTDQNAQSLVTLLEIGDKKALFCGDATFSTEHFLVKSQSKLIGNVQFLPAPHHGSEYASSIPFVDLVKPKQVAVSAGFNEHSHLHPRQLAILRWLAKAGNTNAHLIDYWEIDSTKANDTYQDWLKLDLKIDMSASGNFYTLDGVPPAGTYYGVKAAGLLYRASATVDLRETAFEVDPGNPTKTRQFLNYQIG
jgi:hypothetical protein